jgi:hypothetical protein
MSAKLILAFMLAGTTLAIYFGARRDEPPPSPAPVVHDEKPWLTKEAAAQIVLPGGDLGPLFKDVRIGLPVTAEAQARIAEFAKANDVDIQLEVADGDLVAIRFSVSYGGCCGYEGADVLAHRMGRPETGVCCVCGPNYYFNDWTSVSEDGVHMRAKVRVNRVLVRWEKIATNLQLLDRAESLIGADRDALAKSAGDHWYVIEPNRRFLLEVPFSIPTGNDYGSPPRLEDRNDMGMFLTAHAGVITEVSVSLREPYNAGEANTDLPTMLKARWGRPKTGEYGDMTWRTPDRVVTASPDSSTIKVTITRH